MATNRREVIEGVQYQGVDEVISYTVNVAALMPTPSDTPTAVAVVVKDDHGATVTAAVMPTNGPSVADGVISLSPLRSLTAGVLYRVEVRYDIGGNTLESYFYVQAEM